MGNSNAIFPRGEKASADIGISPNTQNGGAVWLSLVTNEEYQKATK